MSDGAVAERIYASWSYGSQSRQFAIVSVSNSNSGGDWGLK
jgi:hypothetical protein